ncbi:MAG: sugar phosphate isomerase/epimerase family protein [Chloroflexota bacterium]
MDLGIFAKTFVRPSLAEVLNSVTEHGFTWLQFNLSCAGLPTLPDYISEETVAAIQEQMKVRGLRMAALSGTFNLIHPNPIQRQTGLQRLRTLAQACAGLDVSLVTLCTGSRNPNNMWQWHPANDTPEAWRDLILALEIALEIAQESDIYLGIEPELGNVINSAAKARRLLDEMQSPRLKIIMDGANLLQADQVADMTSILEEAFTLLGGEIVLAHAKDISPKEQTGHSAAGTGLLAYDQYLHLLHQAKYQGPLILHSLTEAQVPKAVQFLQQRLEPV